MSIAGIVSGNQNLIGNVESGGTVSGRVSALKVYHTDAYMIAVQRGFKGTIDEWLESLKGDTPIRGVDYWTEEDKAYIIEKVSANLLYPASVE